MKEGSRCLTDSISGMARQTSGRLSVLHDSRDIAVAPPFRQLESFGTHLGIAIDNHRLNERERQFAVVQERTFMAQGLHDSIAQTLSFLNMQVQLLESALAGNDKQMVDETVKQIKAGVQESYENVRELLLNFREKIHKEDFKTALLTVTRRFEAQSGVSAKVQFSGNGPNLTEKQKLQVTFIIQEALSNIRKHAKASQVEVRIITATLWQACGITASVLTGNSLRNGKPVTWVFPSWKSARRRSRRNS